ncbi:MAG: hypothetical protein NTX03_10070 [Bacteroidetes bacterium]|nr:hypothetical protein [Bacteroidota bacterium]
MKTLLFGVTILIFAACTKDRTFTEAHTAAATQHSTPPAKNIYAGILKVNEYVASAKTEPSNFSEYGIPSDWFEIYNASDSTVLMKKGEWFVSDSIPNPEKFSIPTDITINGHGFVVLWCDDSATVIKNIHTNFGLSKKGEDIAIAYRKNGKTLLIDSYTFPAQSISDASFGRKPDGMGAWTNFTDPTPGKSNN